MTDNPSPPPARPEDPSDPGVLAMAENIRVLQAVRKYTDQQMADAVGVSLSTWQRRKQEPWNWSLAQARRIARVLDVDLARLTALAAPGRLPDEQEVSNGA